MSWADASRGMDSAIYSRTAPIGSGCPGYSPLFQVTGGAAQRQRRRPGRPLGLAVQHHLAGVVRIGLDLELAAGLVGLDRVLRQVLVHGGVVAIAVLELD